MKKLSMIRLLNRIRKSEKNLHKIKESAQHSAQIIKEKVSKPSVIGLAALGAGIVIGFLVPKFRRAHSVKNSTQVKSKTVAPKNSLVRFLINTGAVVSSLSTVTLAVGRMLKK